MTPARDEHGYILAAPLVVGRPMSGKELFRYRLFLNGIRDEGDIAALWHAEQSKPKPAKKPKKKRNR